MAKVPQIHFDSHDLPQRERFERWCSAVPTYEIFDLGAPDEFHVVADAWLMGEVIVSTTQVTPVRFRRPPKLLADGNDRIIFFLTKRGTGTADFDGRPAIYGPGQVMLIDLARPFDGSGAEGGTDSISVNVPRAPIVVAAPGADLHGLMLREAAGRIIADHIILLARRLPHMDLDEVPSAVKATVGLFASCVGEAVRLQESEGRDRELRVRYRVGHYIDQNLGAPDLSPEKICDALGVSRSVLYRAFEPLAGVAEHIRARRLETVHMLLEDPAVDRTIFDIAGDFGFSSEAHFSRTFRQRYGYSPRSARQRKASELDDLARVVDSHGGPGVFRAWVEQLG